MLGECPAEVEEVAKVETIISSSNLWIEVLFDDLRVEKNLLMAGNGVSLFFSQLFFSSVFLCRDGGGGAFVCSSTRFENSFRGDAAFSSSLTHYSGFESSSYQHRVSIL